MKAFVFPGQGAQFTGMGKDLYESNPVAKELFDKANEILGFEITKIMFEGTAEELKQTKVTQPAVFLHSVIKAICLGDEFDADMVGGHSLGEFSALVAAGAMSFEDGLKLVAQRAMAMQKACEAAPSTMAAIIGLDDSKIEEICASISKPGHIVVPANYNNPGQLVISGNVEAINEACEALKAAGAKRALVLPVGGAFHSPLMQPAKDELQAAIEATTFSEPRGNQAEPHSSAHSPCQVDIRSAGHDSSWSRRLHRVWTWQGTPRHDSQDRPQRCHQRHLINTRLSHTLWRKSSFTKCLPDFLEPMLTKTLATALKRKTDAAKWPTSPQPH